MTLEQIAKLQRAWRLLHTVGNETDNEEVLRLAEELAGLEVNYEGEDVYMLHVNTNEEEIACPSCGAPIPLIGAHSCPGCGYSL